MVSLSRLCWRARPRPRPDPDQPGRQGSPESLSQVVTCKSSQLPPIRGKVIVHGPVKPSPRNRGGAFRKLGSGRACRLSLVCWRDGNQGVKLYRVSIWDHITSLPLPLPMMKDNAYFRFALNVDQLLLLGASVWSPQNCAEVASLSWMARECNRASQESLEATQLPFFCQTVGEFLDFPKKEETQWRGWSGQMGEVPNPAA